MMVMSASGATAALESCADSSPSLGMALDKRSGAFCGWWAAAAVGRGTRPPLGRYLVSPHVQKRRRHAGVAHCTGRVERPDIEVGRTYIERAIQETCC